MASGMSDSKTKNYKVKGQNQQDSVSPIIVNSVVEVKATAALSRKVQEELVANTKEINMKELLDAEKNKRND